MSTHPARMSSPGTDESSVCESPDARTSVAIRPHHIAIETFDLENSMAWYGAFLDCRAAWSLATFSETTHSRLPGISRLVEMRNGDVRFHIFERQPTASRPCAPDALQFQHIALAVATDRDLRALRDRWLDLFAAGHHTFVRSEPPTEIVTDADGVQNFYCYDVHGLELELTYLPEVST